MKHFRKESRQARHKGLTLVEILIVITVIALVTGLATFAATSYTKTSRDSSRESKAAVIASALEKYYDENGEYPSVELMVSPNVDLVKQRLNVADKDVFKFPLASSTTTNSVTSATSSTTRLKYAATTVDPTQNIRDQCQTNISGYCDNFELSYIREADGKPVVIKSQHNDVVVFEPETPPAAPSISGSYINSSTIRFTASGSSCGSLSTEYKIRYNTTSASVNSMPDWSEINWTTSATRDINPGSFVNFYMQGIARCVRNLSDVSPASANGAIATYVKPTPPPTPTVTASAIATSSTSIRLTYSSPTATGYTVSGPGSAASCTSSPCTVTGLTGGTYYTFNVRASNIAGSSATRSVSVTTTPAPNTPAAPTGTAVYYASSTHTIWVWNAVSCNVGTPQYAFRLYYPGYGSSTGQWTTSGTSAELDTSSQGYIYRLYVQARCINGGEVSGYSDESAAADWTRGIVGASWIYDGWTRIVHPGTVSMWGQSRVTGVSQSCPATAPSTLRYRVNFNDVNMHDGILVVPEGSNYGYWRSDMDLGDKIEFKWWSACYNATTGKIGSEGWNYADIFGNGIVEVNRNANNNGQWSRNCGGGSSDAPTNRDVACTTLTPRAPNPVE